MSTNSVTLTGNLTDDPELRVTGTGKSVANLRLAVTEKLGEKDSTLYISVSAWGRLGENATENLKKGDRVVVQGRLRGRSWETPAGEKRSTYEVNADSIGKELTFVDNAPGAAKSAPRRSSEPAPVVDSGANPFF